MTDKEVHAWENPAVVGKNKEEYDVYQWNDIIVSDDEIPMKLSNQVFLYHDISWKKRISDFSVQNK